MPAVHVTHAGARTSNKIARRCKMSKKLLALIAAIAVAALFLTGCGADEKQFKALQTQVAKITPAAAAQAPAPTPTAINVAAAVATEMAKPTVTATSTPTPSLLEVVATKVAILDRADKPAATAATKTTVSTTPKITTAPSKATTAVSTSVKGKADVSEGTSTFTTGNWKVVLYDGSTDLMKAWFKNIKNLAPESWPNFPNVNNPQVGFKAANGLEYGLDERNYCPQESCDVVVAAHEYNLITADYDMGFVKCSEENGRGCAIMFVNVGNVSANLEDIVVDNGFSVTGRYWNGDALDEAIWGGLSHATANMLNIPTSLNPVGSSNAGANCSVPTGCVSVMARTVIMSGNQILVMAETVVSK